MLVQEKLNIPKSRLLMKLSVLDSGAVWSPAMLNGFYIQQKKFTAVIKTKEK